MRKRSSTKILRPKLVMQHTGCEYKPAQGSDVSRKLGLGMDMDVEQLQYVLIVSPLCIGLVTTTCKQWCGKIVMAQTDGQSILAVAFKTLLPSSPIYFILSIRICISSLCEDTMQGQNNAKIASYTPMIGRFYLLSLSSFLTSYVATPIQSVETAQSMPPLIFPHHSINPTSVTGSAALAEEQNAIVGKHF